MPRNPKALRESWNWGVIGRFVTATFFLLSISILARALDPDKKISQFMHTSWSAKEGIPGPVRAIAQTPDGYLWLGTEAGLLRFDGTHFVLWEAEKTERLPNYSVWSLCVSRDGGLWLGLGSGGISRLRNGKVTNDSPSESVPEGGVLACLTIL